MSRPLSERLAAAMEDVGLTTGKLAVAVGVTPAAVSQWLSGACNPSTANLIKIAAACGVSIDSLAGAESAVEEPAA